MFIPDKEGPTLKPNSSKLGHLSRLKSFNPPDLLHFILDTKVFKCVWPPHERYFNPCRPRQTFVFLLLWLNNIDVHVYVVIF